LGDKFSQNEISKNRSAASIVAATTTAIFAFGRPADYALKTYRDYLWNVLKSKDLPNATTGALAILTQAELQELEEKYMLY